MDSSAFAKSDSTATTKSTSSSYVDGKKGSKQAHGKRAGGARMQYDDPAALAKLKKVQIVKRDTASHVVPFLSHLPQYDTKRASTGGVGLSSSHDEIHPAVTKFGLQCAEGGLRGAMARTAAFAVAIKSMIHDFVMTTEGDIRRELDKAVKRSVQFVIDCRPMSVAMGNFIRYLKQKISDLPADMTEMQAKKEIETALDSFVQEKIELSRREITETGANRAVQDGDTILVYSKSAVIEDILVRAHELGKKFRVICIDSRPKYEGYDLANHLSKCKNISVEYGLINAVSYYMPYVSSVLLGANSLMCNGAVLSASGTGTVAILARRCGVPVIVACESVKFSDRAQLDSLCFNEIAHPDELLLKKRTALKVYGPDEIDPSEPLEDWRKHQNLYLLNLVYDLTPLECVDAVLTELGVIPASSVPVIIREYS